MRSIVDFLVEGGMWMGPLYGFDPRFVSEEWMSSTETGDQAIPRSPADAMAKSSHWRKSA